MTLEIKDLIGILSLILAAGSMLLVSRNTRNATAVNAQNVDLARIRDLRSELTETKSELDKVRAQVVDLSRLATEANDRAIGYARREAEMLRYARMPGVTIGDWLARFDPDGTPELDRR